MKDWIMELCPEISEWQAKLIAEQVQEKVAAEREACARVCDGIKGIAARLAAVAIRARGEA